MTLLQLADGVGNDGPTPEAYPKYRFHFRKSGEDSEDPVRTLYVSGAPNENYNIDDSVAESIRLGMISQGCTVLGVVKFVFAYENLA